MQCARRSAHRLPTALTATRPVADTGGGCRDRSCLRYVRAESLGHGPGAGSVAASRALGNSLLRHGWLHTHTLTRAGRVFHVSKSRIRDSLVLPERVSQSKLVLKET